MAISATFVGALTGVATMVYANGIRKLPAMRQPWGHVMFAVAGAYGANQVVAYEKQVTEELSDLLEQRKTANKAYHTRSS